MLERDVVVTTRHGNMPAFAVCPEGAGAWPGVLFYMDAWSIREELRNMARRIARRGYFCLLPDLYYRVGTLRFDVPRKDETLLPILQGAINHLSNARVRDDTAGMVAFLDGQDRVKEGPLGAVGYCMGGAFVTDAAAYFPKRIGAAASLYGTRLVTDKPDSPHLVIKQAKAEFYYAFAETDRAVPAETVKAFEKALVGSGVKHKVETFSGTHHGFCFPERDVYSHDASETTWERMFDLWDGRLR